MKSICDGLARAIARRAAREDADVEVISYGLQGIIGTAVETALIILAGLVLGMLKELLVMSAAFVVMRLMAGGVHFSTYIRCMTSSVLIFVLGGLLVRLASLLPGAAGTGYVAAGSLFAAYSVFKYSPRDNPNRLIGAEELPRLRRASLAVTGILIAALVLGYIMGGGIQWYHYSLVTGLVLEGFTLTDYGYMMVKHIEEKLDKGGGIRNEES